MSKAILPLQQYLSHEDATALVARGGVPFIRLTHTAAYDTNVTNPSPILNPKPIRVAQSTIG